MSGFFRHDGTWVERGLGTPQGGQQQALTAVRQAIDRVQCRESTAREEVRQLLIHYPVLRQELKDKDGLHPLIPLMSHYTDEVLGTERSDSR